MPMLNGDMTNKSAAVEGLKVCVAEARKNRQVKIPNAFSRNEFQAEISAPSR